jgi:hypothetical protein
VSGYILQKEDTQLSTVSKSSEKMKYFRRIPRRLSTRVLTDEVIQSTLYWR